MSTSDVSICNLALQKLGANRITSLSDNDRNARSMNACYEAIRDRELRRKAWKFAIKRATLAPSATEPDFDYSYAFLLPVDFLRLILPPYSSSDWVMEQHTGQPAILTNDGDTLEIRYVAKVTDPTLFDPLFVDALACALALHCCEELTQSNTKQSSLTQQYRDAMTAAARLDAFEKMPETPSDDSWFNAREL